MGRKHDKKGHTEKTLTAIRKLLGDDMTPSLRKIGSEIGVPSSSQVRFYVDELEKMGKIRRNKTGNILLVSPKSPKSNSVRKGKIRIVSQERSILDIPNYGPIAAGIPIHLPDASFKKTRKSNLEQAVVHIPESYLPAGVKAEDVFALHVEGDSMRDAMLTDGDIVILQKTSIDQVKDGDIVAAWLIDTQATTLKRFEKTKRGISLRPENPDYDILYLQSDEVDIQGKLLAVLRFRY